MEVGKTVWEVGFFRSGRLSEEVTFNKSQMKWRSKWCGYLGGGGWGWGKDVPSRGKGRCKGAGAKLSLASCSPARKLVWCKQREQGSVWKEAAHGLPGLPSLNQVLISKSGPESLPWISDTRMGKDPKLHRPVRTSASIQSLLFLDSRKPDFHSSKQVWGSQGILTSVHIPDLDIAHCLTWTNQDQAEPCPCTEGTSSPLGLQLKPPSRNHHHPVKWEHSRCVLS